jgi:DNA-binding XRE family transcriptional regulator
MQNWIGADLLYWRKGLDLTQEQVAGILDISSRTIITWEKSQTPIKRHVMLACLYIEENPGIVPKLQEAGA